MYNEEEPASIVLALANLQPLVTRSFIDNYVYGSTTSATTWGFSSPWWVCQFCGCRQQAETDAYGNTRSHQGDFPHADDCLWKRAKECAC